MEFPLTGVCGALSRQFLDGRGKPPAIDETPQLVQCAPLWAGDLLNGSSSSRLAAHGTSSLKGDCGCRIHGRDTRPCVKEINISTYYIRGQIDNVRGLKKGVEPVGERRGRDGGRCPPGSERGYYSPRPAASTSRAGGSSEGSWQCGQGPDRPQQQVAVQLEMNPKWILCRSQSMGKVRISRASERPDGSSPLRIASRISGASVVSFRMRTT